MGGSGVGAKNKHEVCEALAVGEALACEGGRDPSGQQLRGSNDACFFVYWFLSVPSLKGYLCCRLPRKKPARLFQTTGDTCVCWDCSLEGKPLSVQRIPYVLVQSLVGPHSMDRFFVPVSRKIDRGDPWNSFHLVWAFGFTLGRLSWEFTCGERLKDVKRSQPLGPLVGSCIPGIIFLCPQV